MSGTSKHERISLISNYSFYNQQTLILISAKQFVFSFYYYSSEKGFSELLFQINWAWNMMIFMSFFLTYPLIVSTLQQIFPSQIVAYDFLACFKKVLGQQNQLLWSFFVPWKIDLKVPPCFYYVHLTASFEDYSSSTSL